MCVCVERGVYALVFFYGPLLPEIKRLIDLSCLAALGDIFHTPMARYSLFVLKVPLDINQLTN